MGIHSSVGSPVAHDRQRNNSIDMSLEYFEEPESSLPLLPFRAVLISAPDSDYARSVMTVGKVYTVYRLAGSCYEVSTNQLLDRTLVWRGRFEAVRP